LNLNVSYDSPGGGSFDNERDLHAIPQLFYSCGLTNSHLAFGLGIYSPYGLSSKWSEESGFRTVGLEASLKYWTFNPVVAFEVVPGLAIAAGPTVNYATTVLKQGLTPIPGNDHFKFDGEGTDVGFNAGVLWQPHRMLSLGASYRSATSVDFDGEGETIVRNAVPPAGLPALSIRRDARADFQFPQNVIVGISFRPTPDWNLEFNADWTDWDQLNSLRVRWDGFPASPETVFNWESSWYYEFGATRYFGDGWSVSAGYIFNENSVPDAHYTPLVADLDRHFGSVGVGYTGARLNVDVAYQFGYGPVREVTGSAVTPAGQSADGDYEFTSHAVLATLGFRF
jgi:long-chain fatty acid transport protein